jgi:hypothetical protein
MAELGQNQRSSQHLTCPDAPHAVRTLGLDGSPCRIPFVGAGTPADWRPASEGQHPSLITKNSPVATTARFTGLRLQMINSQSLGDSLKCLIIMTGNMQSKTERIKIALANGDWLSALRTASRFHDRSADTLTFKRGFDAYQHPDFYRQLGKNPDELISDARKRLQARFLVRR